MELISNNIQFVHFGDEETIEKFIDYIKDENLAISHKCCNGKGLGIFINENIDLEKIINDFLNPRPKNIEYIETISDTCCVCRENTTRALNCIQPHHICIECFEHIKNECPYCRRKLL
jgi:hypothetical protein